MNMDEHVQTAAVKESGHRKNAALERRREELWQEAEKRLHSLFGSTPPEPVTARFAMEKMMMRGSESIILYSVLGRVREFLRDKGSDRVMPHQYRTPSFVAWLLGASILNPLPVHLRCPECGAVRFPPDTESGWIYPPEKCACGAYMRQEGMGLDYGDSTGGHYICTKFLGITVPPELEKEVWERVLKETGPLYVLERRNDVFSIVRHAKEEPPVRIWSDQLVLIYGKPKAHYTRIEDAPQLSREQFMRKSAKYPVIGIYPGYDAE